MILVEELVDMGDSIHAITANRHLTAFGVRLDLVGFDSP